MNLNLIPTHPDRCAGLAFVGKSAYAFGPILFAQGVPLLLTIFSPEELIMHIIKVLF